MLGRNPHTVSDRKLAISASVCWLLAFSAADYGDEVEVLRSPSSGAIVLGIQEFPVVATGSWVAELGILVPE